MTTTNTYDLRLSFASKNCQGSGEQKLHLTAQENLAPRLALHTYRACKKKGVTRLFDQLAHYECFNTMYGMLICCIVMTEHFTKL